MGKTGRLCVASGENVCGVAMGVPVNGSNSLACDRHMDPHDQRACLIRAVSSCTRLYTERSSRMSRVILSFAWMTVV